MIAAALLRSAALALAGLAAACGDVPRAGDEVVRLWAMGREGEVVEALVPEFERRHPGLAVEVQRIPWSAAHEKLLTAFVGGAMPDVIQAGNTWLPELVALGAIEPLDARIAASPRVERADWFPGVLDTNVIEGRTWGLPWYVDTRLLFYRSDLLAEAGWPRAPRTWSEWLAAMIAVKARDGGRRAAILLPLADWQPVVVLAFARGARLLRDDDGRGDFRSPEFAAATAFYVELFRRGLAPLGGAASAADLYQDFARGDVSFAVTGPWNLGEFGRRLPPALAGRWATAPMPVADEVPAPGREALGTPADAAAPPPPGFPGPSLAGGASLALVRGSGRADAGWRLIEFLTEPAQQVRLHQLTGDLPARRSAWEAAALAREPHVAAFWDQLQSVWATPKIPEWERIAGKVTQYTDAAVRGRLGIDAALAALDAEVDVILAKRRWLRAGRPVGGA